MEWFNVHTSILDSEEFVCSKPVDQATWLKLERYCIGQENGGVIQGAQAWTDRQWQHLVRATRKEVRRNCKLWEWVGDDLKVMFYPSDKELEIKAKRRSAHSTHAKRGDKRPAEHDAEHGAEHVGKGRKGNGKPEGKEGGSPNEDPSSPDVAIPSLVECIHWGQTAGVSEDWIRAKYTNTTGTHGWVRNGKVISWRLLWKAWFDEAQADGSWKKNPAPRAGSDNKGEAPPPPGGTNVDFDAMRS